MVLSRPGSGRRSFPAALASSVLLAGLLLGMGQRAADAAASDALVPVLLKDVNPGPANSSASKFTLAGDSLFFAATDGANGQEWQKTDGTTAGTSLVNDIRAGSGDAGLSSRAAAFGGKLFFGASDGTYGNELWSTDGTAAGTAMVKDINPGAGNGSPSNFAVVGGTLFFTAADGATGDELWKTDGTAAGTVLVKDINPGVGGSNPPILTAVGNTVFFAAYEASAGQELWKSDGTTAGTTLVRDINPGTGWSEIRNMVTIGSTAFFSANNGSTTGNGRELWKSDGTTLGTVLVRDINPGSFWSDPTGLAVVGTTVYFSASDSSGTELWKSDGSLVGTVLVRDIFPGNNSFPGDLTAFGGILLFRATGPAPAGGAEVWKSDGTAAGTVLVKDIFAGSGNGGPAGFTVVGSTAFFSATDGTTGTAHGTELWSTDGTTAGTVLVGDINPGTASSSPSSLTSAFGTLFFAATDGVTGVEPWRLRTNRVPVAGADAYSARTGSPRTLLAPGVLANDTDADRDPLSAGPAGDPANGTVNLNADGSFTYTPDAGFTGTDSFTYVVSDGFGGTATGTVTMTVGAEVNRGPVAVNDAYNTNEDTPLAVPAPGVVGNDTDADGDALTATLASAPTHGTVILTADGSFTYTSAANFAGSDTFTYLVSDGYGGTAPGTVTITVPGVNDAPVAGGDTYSTNSADPPLTVPVPGVLGNDSDDDGDALSAGSASTPAHGTVILNAEGSFTYTPNPGFGGVDTFTYRVSDGNGGTATATVTVNVFNESSVTSVKGSACSYLTNVGLFGGPQTLLGCGEGGRAPGPTPAPGSTIATDPSYSPHVALPADGSGGAMTATDVDGATARYGPAVIHGGRWPCAEDGDRNCPQAGPPSGPQVASTQGTPPGGTVTSSVDISLHETPIPVGCYPGYGPNCYSVGGFGPMPVEGDSLHAECSASKTAVSGSTTFSDALLVTSTDAEGEPLTQEPVPDNPPVNYTRHGVINHVGDVFTVVYNQQIVNADGSLTVNAVHMYLFGPTAVGEVIRGSVTCGTNPSPLTPTDTVAPTCGTPVVKPVSPTNPSPQVPRSELVGVFDAGNGGNTGLQSITNVQVTNGSVQVGSPSSPQAYMRFTPGQTGPLPITATRTDESLPMYWSFDATDVAGNTSHCRGAQSPPLAVDDAYATNESTALTVPAPGVLGNDTDPEGNSLTAGSASDPAHGNVSLLPDGSFSYVPDALFRGRDTFTYVASDGYGSDTGLVTIFVGVANGVPVAVDDTATTNEDTPVAVAAPGVLGNDTDPDGDPLSAGSASDPANGAVTLNGDGAYTYTPNAGFHGTDSFTYAVSDGFGGSDTGLVTVTVVAVNDVPVAGDDAYDATEDTPLTVAAPGVVGNDTDADGDGLTAGSASAPANGSVVLNPDGSFSYTPDADFAGSDGFSYRVSDGQGGAATASVTIAVAAVSDPPVAVDDAFNVTEDTALAVAAPGVVGNDVDVDGDALSVAVVSAPASGSLGLNADGSFTYTPNADFAGTDGFSYSVSDGSGGVDTGEVTIVVAAVNDVPVAGDDAYGTASGVPVTVAAPGVLGNDADVDGDPLDAGSATDPSGGSVTLDADGSFTYTPDAGFSGTDTFSYVASDGRGGTDSATVTVTVAPPPPVAGPTTLTVGDVLVAEGSGGTTAATFTVSRSGDVSGSSTVKYKTTNGTATVAGADYTGAALTTLSFAAGETSKAVSVDVAADVLPEADETFSLVLSVPAGAVLADSAAVATVLNDDGAAWLAVDSVSVTEGSSGASPVTFTITRSGNTNGVSTVRYRTAVGTATVAGGDYTEVPSTTVSFGAGETSKTVNVDVTGDVVDEKNETFSLVLAGAIGATIADATGTATIVDDEGPVVPGPSTFLAVDSIFVTEGATGATAAVFSVTRSGDTAGATTVKYTTTAGTATAGADFTGVPAGTVLSFGAGEATKTVTVDVAGDHLAEKHETFNLVLSVPTGAAIADAAGTATILNDDGAAYLTVDNVQVIEGHTGTTAATFTVTRSGNTNGASAVKVKTSGGTATAGTDYTAITTLDVTFGPGETTKTVTVNVTGDVTTEATETFNLILSNPVGATISDTAGTAKILNDD